MLAKRKMSVTELTEKVGITMANLSILKNGKAKAVRFSTLEADGKIARSAASALTSSSAEEHRSNRQKTAAAHNPKINNTLKGLMIMILS